VKDKKKENFIGILKLIGVGLLAGFVNGFFGAGGGLLLVPMIELVRQGDSKTAHATTLGCVLVMCLASSVVYFVKRQIDFSMVDLTIGIDNDEVGENLVFLDNKFFNKLLLVGPNGQVKAKNKENILKKQENLCEYNVQKI
jgi:hypothetical protein